MEEEHESMAEAEGEDENGSLVELSDDEEIPCAQPHGDPVPDAKQLDSHDEEQCMEESSGIGVLNDMCAAGDTGEMGQVEETQQMEIQRTKKDIEK